MQRPPISRILWSVPTGQTDDHFSSPNVTTGVKRPTRRPWPGQPPSYLVLHRVGFAVPPRSPLGRWALTPPFHPYRALRALITFNCSQLKVNHACSSAPAVYFLWHFPSPDKSVCQGPGCYPAPCPVVFGLSSRRFYLRRGERSPVRPQHASLLYDFFRASAIERMVS